MQKIKQIPGMERKGTKCQNRTKTREIAQEIRTKAQENKREGVKNKGLCGAREKETRF
jgi:hypothetical protein